MYDFRIFLPQKAQRDVLEYLICCNIGYFSIHGITVFTQTTLILVWNNFKDQHLVYLEQVFLKLCETAAR